MSVPEFREILLRETERHLGKLEKAALAEDGTGELPNLPELRRLANSMSDNILNRLTDHAASWGVDADVINGTDNSESKERSGEGASLFADGASPGRAQLEARCRELEVLLQQRRMEEERRKEEVLSRFKAEYDTILRQREQELEEVRQAATFDPEAEVSDADAAKMQEFTEQVQRIQGQIEKTKDAVGKLDGKKKGLEKIEGQQRKAVHPIEALLASTIDGNHDEEDQALADKIRHGEQVCKRMRRLAAGA
ncbi:unnamed protein product [Polarella glacialis]|uniref:Uncharacterized protein n=2 Tax=Polarella glacialis TaxID=89957 RepID=A0A813D976_POLGL|nr:unnamed protein product [Polarella glacialis]